MEVNRYEIFSFFDFKLREVAVFNFTGLSRQINFQAYDNFQHIILLADFAVCAISEHMATSNFTQHIKPPTFTKSIFQYFKNLFFIRPIFPNDHFSHFAFIAANIQQCATLPHRFACTAWGAYLNKVLTHLLTGLLSSFFHQRGYKAKFI